MGHQPLDEFVVVKNHATTSKPGLTEPEMSSAQVSSAFGSTNRLKKDPMSLTTIPMKPVRLMASVLRARQQGNALVTCYGFVVDYRWLVLQRVGIRSRTTTHAKRPASAPPALPGTAHGPRPASAEHSAPRISGDLRAVCTPYRGGTGPAPFGSRIKVNSTSAFLLLRFCPLEKYTILPVVIDFLSNQKGRTNISSSANGSFPRMN